MTLFELVETMQGELVSNQARVRRDGKWVILGRVVNNVWELTEVGQRLLDTANTPADLAPEPVKPARKPRTPRTVARES
jgi:hypothetical protein